MQEVSVWLASAERATLFDMLGRKLVAELTASDYCGGNGGAGTYTVFIVGDNEEVKRALKEYVIANVSLPMAVLTTNSAEGLVHIGDAEHSHSRRVMQALAFDWYVISLCNVVLGWRLGGSTLQSTFLHSAQRMGVEKCRGEGGANVKGSRGFVLESRRGRLDWSPMFQYGVFDQTVLDR